MYTPAQGYGLSPTFWKKKFFFFKFYISVTYVTTNSTVLNSWSFSNTLWGNFTTLINIYLHALHIITSNMGSESRALKHSSNNPSLNTTIHLQYNINIRPTIAVINIKLN